MGQPLPRARIQVVALWERKPSVVIPPVILELAHWALLYRTIFVVTAVWDDNQAVNKSSAGSSYSLNFSNGFRFIILVATFVALMARHSARTDLWRLLLTDGLCYFIISFTMNCVPAVLNLLNLNLPMNV
ncbi:hypothetical protein K438DRAFT_34781 [Mycena galopus ATCC 62051]|nr:hypothetical protein K438DRAFT_34781 [Mycena galopus ATCC 62051]